MKNKNQHQTSVLVLVAKFLLESFCPGRPKVEKMSSSSVKMKNVLKAEGWALLELPVLPVVTTPSRK